jgi:hypothetical protein
MGKCTFWKVTQAGVVAAYLACAPALAADAVKQAAVKIAVFDFELDDVTPAAALLNKSTTDAEALDKVSTEARRALAQSGRYSIVDVSKVDAKPVKEKMLRNCDGCDAGIAAQLGADQSLVGIVRRATQTDYYVLIVIRDARSGKLIDQQGANFAGGEEGWASGVRMLIKHQLLVSED